MFRRTCPVVDWTGSSQDLEPGTVGNGDSCWSTCQGCAGPESRMTGFFSLGAIERYERGSWHRDWERSDATSFFVFKTFLCHVAFSSMVLHARRVCPPRVEGGAESRGTWERRIWRSFFFNFFFGLVVGEGKTPKGQARVAAVWLIQIQWISSRWGSWPQFASFDW